MRYSVAAHRWLASLFLLPVALLACGCIKLPRHLSTATAQTAGQTLQQEATSAPLININTASLDELEKLPGIGQALAARIVAHRRQYGRFRRAEHLMMVRGISDRRFRALRALITVE
ncbi:MAG: helix-hairpin-helix domain-containing protein [Acidobacteria bacterium]|nr:helix-hairpin-helix domain-containing protein [Acidobacteriota bacterium]